MSLQDDIVDVLTKELTGWLVGERGHYVDQDSARVMAKAATPAVLALVDPEADEATS